LAAPVRSCTQGCCCQGSTCAGSSACGMLGGDAVHDLAELSRDRVHGHAGVDDMVALRVGPCPLQIRAADAFHELDPLAVEAVAGSAPAARTLEALLDREIEYQHMV